MTGARRTGRRVGVVPAEELAGSAAAGDEFLTALTPGALATQLRLIESTKATERARGVHELAELLREDAAGRNTLAASIGAGVWESALSWTAGMLIKEAQSFVNKHGEEWPQLSPAAERLANRIQTQYAVHIRHIWVLAMPYLSSKLARFLTKHIVDSLATDPCLVAVFGLDYAKVLRAWAAHEPHVYSCKDSRARAIADLCIGGLLRRGNAPELQASADTALAQSIQPGDVELTAALLAIVSAATPARLAGMGEAVLDFCTEYCRLHTRESPCTSAVLGTANTVLLARADTQVAQDPERTRSLLSSCLQLWTTRSEHLKRAVLNSTRILTRLVGHQLAAEPNDSDSRALLELALKTLTSGAWDRHKFMALPSTLLGLFPLVHGRAPAAAAAIVPLQLFAPLHATIDPRQLAFFDTVAYLAALLTRLPPRQGGTAGPHRKRRRQAPPTSLSRLLTEIGSGESPAKACGAAQAVWYIVNVYPDLLGEDRCAGLLGDVRSLIQSSDMSQRGELAGWILGTLRTLLSRETPRGDAGSRDEFDDVWRHATAGVESGVGGAAGLVFDLLHRTSRPAADTHALCRQAAAALCARTAAHDADSARLVLFLAQYMRPDSAEAADDELARVSSQALLQMCEDAARHQWPVGMFTLVVSSVLDCPAAASTSIAPVNRTVFSADWCLELRFTAVLHTLAMLSDCPATCARLLNHHTGTPQVPGALAPTTAMRADTVSAMSNVSPAQWHLVSAQLLRFIEQITSLEHGEQLLGAAMPYAAHVLWRISEHLSAADGGSAHSAGDDGSLQLAQRVVDGFSERFHAFVAESRHPELVWHTMAFIAPWTSAYTRIAALEVPIGSLLDALLGSSDAQLLCDLATGRPGRRYPAALFSGRGIDEPQVPGGAPRTNPPSAAADGAEAQRHRSALEAHMLGVAAGLQQHRPCADIARVISGLVDHNEGLRSAMSDRLAALISRLDDAPFLVASGLVLKCVLLVSSSSSVAEQTLGKLKDRVLSFLDNNDYIGHMPTVFTVMQTMVALLEASPDHQCLRDDEDVARFVAWLDADARQGRIDPFIEAEFAQSVLGPWARGESTALASALAVLNAQPTEMLLRCAQASMGFASRVAAEEQLARQGLALPYLQPSGALVFTEAPELTVDETLVLVTRNFGLALLIGSSGSLVPGALCILLRQLDPQSGCPPRVTQLCRRLLSSIAARSGFTSTAGLVSACVPEIVSMDPGMYDTLDRIQRPTSEDESLQWRAYAALEWMLRGDFARAREVLPSADGPWMCWLDANLLVTSADDPELYARIGEGVLEPHYSAARLAAASAAGWTERLLLHLFLLFRPEKHVKGELASALDALRSADRAMPVTAAYIEGCRQDPQLQQLPLPQWGRRYGAQQIRAAISAMLAAKGAGDMSSFLTGPRVAWLALHIETQLQAACDDDRRQQLAASLCLLARLAPADALDSPLVQAIFMRALVDNWLCGRESIGALCSLAVGMLLDSSRSVPAGKLSCDVFVGLATTLITKLPRLPAHTTARAVRVFACLLQAIAHQQQGTLDASGKLFIGSGLDGLYDWTLLPQVVVTRGAVQQSDDPLALSRIAEAAAQLLDNVPYAPVCAEFVAAAAERILQLALPLREEGSGEKAPDVEEDGGTVRVALVANVARTLLRVRHAVTRQLRASGDGRRSQATTMLLLRAVSVLQMLDEPDTGDTAPGDDKERLAKESDIRWLICNTITTSHDQAAIMAAIRVAAELGHSAGPDDDGTAAVKRLDPQQRWVYRDVLQMPAVMAAAPECPGWMGRMEPPALDSALLESMCGQSRTADSVMSELVCALAVRGECQRIHPALPLMWADARVAGRLLPHVLHEILPQATAAACGEIAAFVLDVSHNWHIRAPGMVREVLVRVLEVRMLDERYSDIRAFFGLLPLALFEVADLAAKLDMPETTAFLLECDLTCTRAERAITIAGISSEARTLLRTVYQRLGNQPAAQLLSSVGTVGDVLRRCRDTADWRTLLLYQEAATGWQQSVETQHQQDTQLCGGGNSGCEIGDTLVNLGLLHSLRPAPGGGDRAGNHGDSSQAAYAASWRLARWDVPVLPFACAASVEHLGGGFVVPVGHLEESLYSIFKMRARSQPREATLAVQECLASPQAVAALTTRASHSRALWPFHAVSTLLPLIADSACGALGSQEFVRASQAAAFLLAKSSSQLGANALEPLHLANLTLHEIAVRNAVSRASSSGPGMASLVFGRYRAAVRAACIASRRSRSWQTSMSHIFRLRSAMQSAGLGDRTLEHELKLWEAETLWDAGNRGLAIEILQAHKVEIERALRRHGVSGAESEAQWTAAEAEAATILLSRVILTVGEWSDKQRSERPAVLWEEYFNKSAHLLENVRSPTAWTGRVLYGLATFAERQCEELATTRDDEAAIAMRKQKAREYAACQQEISKATSAAGQARLRAILRRLEIQVANDQKELAALRSSIDGFLRLAIWSFVKCLECTDAFDDSVYSLVSLVMTHARSAGLQSVLSPGLTDGVPSRKFLPLVHQLCARLSTDDDSFHRTIVHLVQRMAVDYPYHTMYHLFALRNANRTTSSSSLNRRSASAAALLAPDSERMEERRSEAATGILVGASSVGTELHDIVQAMDELCNMYIELAVSPVPEKNKDGKSDGKMIAFDKRLRIARVAKKVPPNVPVLTACPQADAPRDYTGVPFISSVADGYSLAGGINLPKIVRVLATDGRRYKQLVKGKDDMRQDAVIEQLFHVINRFMRGQPGTPLASGLRVRTYQVVPLTKRCGVLQWVDDTVTLGNWFRASDKKYRPSAPTMSQLRIMVHDVHKEKAATVEDKLAVYERVCSVAPPIFRFFFYEHCHSAQSWLERREAYTRSAAVASIAGWVLGVGDRHLHNILVDQSTAEVVHIDLGIAFDLGKLLPIPELVPFRLTREMIDGMGILGLDGTFRHTCHATLQALRDNARVVITILNVLKVDPLYMWSLIPLRQDKINRNVQEYVSDPSDSAAADGLGGYLDEETDVAAAQEENKEAGRSIQHVGQRLAPGISVEGQVSELIQQATDPALLSRMFEGWSAWH